MERVYLSRRNLLTLLSKLDRASMGEETFKALVKCDNRHPKYPQTMPELEVVAIEDAEYYTDRSPGVVYHGDQP